MADSPARELSSINFESMLGGPLMAIINAQAVSAMSSVNFIKAVGFKPPTSKNPMSPETGEPIYVTFKYPKEVAPYQPAVEASVTDLTVRAPGTGYTDGTYDDLSITGGGGGSGAEGTATVSGGKVTSSTLRNAGTGYKSAPDVALPPGAGAGNGAEIVATFQQAQDPIKADVVQMQLEVPILTMLPIPFIRIEEATIDFNAKINSVEEAKTDDSLKIGSSLKSKVQYPPLFAVATVNLKVNTSYQKNTSSGSKVDRTYSMAVHIRAVQDEMPAGMEKVLGILEDSIRSQPVPDIKVK